MSGKHRIEDRVEPAGQRLTDYDGRYGEAEPAGEPDQDEAYAPETRQEIRVMASHYKAQGTSGWV
ncbi:hypothetical protein GCM10009765_54630 [Fodinicola feengrottensis]|uniref:Uncharacterized protein n=1 Tax=Fodinicola feengrottensis TaxID=435914 RepID=A0ABP4U6U0_9ACTN